MIIVEQLDRSSFFVSVSPRSLSSRTVTPFCSNVASSESNSSVNHFWPLCAAFDVGVSTPRHAHQRKERWKSLGDHPWVTVWRRSTQRLQDFLWETGGGVETLRRCHWNGIQDIHSPEQLQKDVRHVVTLTVYCRNAVPSCEWHSKFIVVSLCLLKK